MALSLSQTAALTCPQCKTPFDADIWLIVDAGERADLAARCHDGSIHVVTCPNGHSGMLAAPLLYHDRAKQQLFLAHPQDMSEQQVGEQLIQQLRGQLLILPGSNYLDAPQALPIELLPAAMDDKLDQVMAQLQEQAEAIRRDPRISAALRVLQEHRALGETIQQWINLDAWNDSKQFLEAHPELLTSDAELVLASMLDLARAQDDADAQKTLDEHREIVRIARKNGIDATYPEDLESGTSDELSVWKSQLRKWLEELNVQSPEDLARALHDHPEFQELMERAMMEDNPRLYAINQFMQTRSREEVIQLALAYPMLLDDEGLSAISKIISDASSSGDEGTVNHLKQRLEILEEIKSGSVQPNEVAHHAVRSNNFGEFPDKVQSILQEISHLSSPSEMPHKIELCESALKHVRREKNPTLWAALIGDLANAYTRTPSGSREDNIELAIYHYMQIQQVYTRTTFPEQWAHTQNNLAAAYADRIGGVRADNLDAAIRHYELALEVYTRGAFPVIWGMAQYNLAIAYADRIRGDRADNLDAAIRHYELALQVYTRTTFPEQWAHTQFNLASTYADRIRGERAGNLEVAIRHYELALEVFSRLAFPEKWATIQNNLAAVYTNRIRGERADNLETAIRYCELALEVHTRTTFPEQWAGMQHNLAVAYANRIRGERVDNLEVAIQRYKLALEVHTRTTFPEKWAAIQNNLAAVYTNRIRGERADNLEMAIRYYELALEVHTQTAFPIAWGMAQHNLANAYRERTRGERADNLEMAIRHYELALEVFSRSAFPERWALTQYNLAIAYSNRICGERGGNLEATIRHYEEALLEYTPENNPTRAFDASRNLADLYAEQKSWLSAHQAFELARDAAELLLRASVTSAGQQAEIRQLADLCARDLAVCAQLYKIDEKIARDAVAESEAACSRVFLRQLGLGDFAPPASIPAALVTQEKSIVAQLREIENNLAGADMRSDRMSEVERTLTERRKKLADELERVWNEMLAASPDAVDYISLRRGDTPDWDELAALAQRVGADAALVEFHLLDDQTLAFIWRKDWDAPKMLSLPLTRERLLYRYLLPYERDVLSTYRRAQANAAQRELYHDWLGLGEELLAPLEPLLGDASLVYFIPHNALHLLPLHALTVNGEPFIARRAVAYAPSAAVLARVLELDSRTQTTDDRNRALVMGYTEHLWQRDIFNGEAVDVAKLFGAASLIDEHATRAALAERAPAASLIHLSCHGAFDGADLLASAVLLADGEFTARDFMRLDLRADLVTLSACQLAFSDVNPGDDLVGMTRAILYAGASSVLLALWSVYADTTLEWMLDFYNRLQPDGTPQAQAQAFRDATLALRAKHDDPYVWAPFVLVGDALKVAR